MSLQEQTLQHLSPGTSVMGAQYTLSQNIESGSKDKEVVPT